jgi:pimeloyl-ACP methyl ester carboxylesterase
MGLVNLFATTAGLLIVLGTARLVYVLQHPKRKTYAYALAKGLPGDPGELGLNYTEQTFRFADGSTTPGWIIEGSNPHGATVVVTHGWNSSRHGSLLRLPALMPHAARLVVYDMRGHGESSAPVCLMGTREADDLVAIITQLNGLDTPVVLYGSSMGAGASIAAAAQADPATTTRITAVIADGPYRHFHEPIAGQMRVRSLPPFPFAWLTTAYMALRLGGLGGFDRAVLAAAVRCPLLVLHGSADPICNIESGRLIAQAAPHGRLTEIPDGGHGDLAIIAPDAYNGALADLFSLLAQSNTLVKTSAPTRQGVHTAAVENDRS